MSISGVTPTDSVIETLAGQLLNLVFDKNADDKIMAILETLDSPQVSSLYQHLESNFINIFLRQCIQHALPKTFAWLIRNSDKNTSVLSTVDRGNNTLLHILANTDPVNNTIADTLLKNSSLSDLLKLNSNGLSFLHLCAQNGKTNLIALTYQSFSDSQTYINVNSSSGETPLHLAVRDKNTSLIILLMTMGADPYATDLSKITPFKMAEGDPELLKKMLEIKIPPHSTIEAIANKPVRLTKDSEIIELEKQFRNLRLSGNQSQASTSSSDSVGRNNTHQHEPTSIIHTHLSLNFEELFMNYSDSMQITASSSENVATAPPLFSPSTMTSRERSPVKLNDFFRRSLLSLTFRKDKNHYIDALQKLTAYLEHESILNLLSGEQTIDEYIKGAITKARTTISIIHQFFIDIKIVLLTKLNLARRTSLSQLNNLHNASTKLIHSLYNLDPIQINERIENIDDIMPLEGELRLVFDMINIINNDISKAPTVTKSLSNRIGPSKLINHLASLIPFLNSYQRNICFLMTSEALYWSFDLENITSQVEKEALEHFMLSARLYVSAENSARLKAFDKIYQNFIELSSIGLPNQQIVQNNIYTINEWLNAQLLNSLIINFDNMIETTLQCRSIEYFQFIKSIAHELRMLSLDVVQTISSHDLSSLGTHNSSITNEVQCFQNLSNLVKQSILSCSSIEEIEPKFTLWVDVADALLEQRNHLGPDIRSTSAIISGLGSQHISRLIEVMPELEQNVKYQQLKTLFTLAGGSSNLKVAESGYPNAIPRIFTVLNQLTLANENQTPANRFTVTGDILLNYEVLRRNLLSNSVISFSDLKTTLQRQYPSDEIFESMSFRLLGPIIHLHRSRNNDLMQSLDECRLNSYMPRFKFEGVLIPLANMSRELTHYVHNEVAQGRCSISDEYNTLKLFLDYLDTWIQSHRNHIATSTRLFSNFKTLFNKPHIPEAGSSTDPVTRNTSLTASLSSEEASASDAGYRPLFGAKKKRKSSHENPKMPVGRPRAFSQ